MRTDLSAPFAGKRPLMEPDETAARLLSVIDNATARDTGSFIAYDGSLIPW